MRTHVSKEFMPMLAHSFRRLILPLLSMVLPVAAIAAELGTDAYRLPLIDSYAICRADKALGVSKDSGLYQLVIVAPPSPGAGLSFITLVPRVELVAVQDRVIFGKSRDGFFILDAGHPDQKPQTLESRERWLIALRAYGVTDSDLLKAPDALATAVPDRVLRPWKYRVMESRFGISDDLWSLVIQLIGLLIAFVIGLAWVPGKSPMLAAIAVGVIVNVVAQILISGGGPGAFVGFVALPLFYMLAAALGKGVRAIATGGRPTGA
jgi:hypothetical protein